MYYMNYIKFIDYPIKLLITISNQQLKKNKIITSLRVSGNLYFYFPNDLFSQQYYLILLTFIGVNIIPRQ